DKAAGGTGDALALRDGIGATSPSPSWGGWLRRSRSRVGAARLFKRRTRITRPSPPGRCATTLPPTGGEKRVALFPTAGAPPDGGRPAPSPGPRPAAPRPGRRPSC